jgi:hypothetical protein
MVQSSIVPSIMALLEPYLETRLALFDAMPRDQRRATLPATPDGKVSVDGMVRDLGCNPNWRQHFFKKRELFDTVNVAAEAMGLAPIGSRALDDEAAIAVRSKLAKVGAAEKRASEDLVEALHRIDVLTTEKEKLLLRVIQLENEIAAIYETGERPFHNPFEDTL